MHGIIVLAFLGIQSFEEDSSFNATSTDNLDKQGKKMIAGTPKSERQNKL